MLAAATSSGDGDMRDPVVSAVFNPMVDRQSLRELVDGCGGAGAQLGLDFPAFGNYFGKHFRVDGMPFLRVNSRELSEHVSSYLSWHQRFLPKSAAEHHFP